MRVLAIDPGAKTGVCLYDAQPPGDLELSLIIPDGLTGFKEWFETYGYHANYDVLVCESFEMEEGTHGIDYKSPLAIINYLEGLGIPIEWQRRMQRGKNTVAKVSVLKRAGLYPKRGDLKEGHQVAALQHALAYLIKKRHMETIRLLHPPEEEAA